MKNTDMLEWMNDLDASYLREAAEPVIRQHKPIKKHLTAAIAAAAAANPIPFRKPLLSIIASLLSRISLKFRV